MVGIFGREGENLLGKGIEACRVIRNRWFVKAFEEN